MSLKQILETRQSHVMTGDLHESLKILQYSRQELVSFINQQLETNPFLDVAESGDDGKVSDENLNFEDYVSKAEYNEASTSNLATPKFSHSRDEFEIEDKLKTLRDHIHEQINIDITCNRTKIIALYLTEMLDDNGYIEPSYNHIHAAIKCSEKEIDEVLATLQNFDPPGIFARNLSECLMLQLKDRGLLNKDLLCLLGNLELLAQMDLAKIKKVCHIDQSKLKEYFAIIKSLNPKPGNIYEKVIVQTIEPDIFLRKHGGKWILELNSNFIPQISINKDYYKDVKPRTKEKEEKKHLTRFYNSASWLVSSLRQRSKTLMKVTEKIVEKQSDFFDKGINYLYSMSLQEIASEIGVSTSTVSRITTNKFIATPLGVFELKYFFSSSLQNSVNSGESNKKAKYMIKLLVENEKKHHIYTDEDIALELVKQGITISRRTVTKYREKMNIPSSSERKKHRLINEFAHAQ